MMATMRINIGPIHPSTHGVLRFVTDVDGDTIKRTETHVGFLHRGVEKLIENRMYMQSPSFMEKMDYIAPLSWDDLYVNTIEKAMGVNVKETAKYARVILLEFQRVASHLLWLGTFCNDLGQMFTSFMWSFRERDRIIKLLQDVSGGRMFYVNIRITGLNRKLPDDFKDRAYSLADYIEERILAYPDVLDSNPIFMERTKGIGVISKDNAIKYGVSGPVLRASGVGYDVRKANPYYIYEKVKFNVPTEMSGDAYARYRIRYYEMLESIKIIRQALDAMPEDNDVVGMPIRLIYPQPNLTPIMNNAELPRGEGIIYMVPDKTRPYRIYLRSGTYTNIAILDKITENIKYADFFAIMGSLDLVASDIDK